MNTEPPTGDDLERMLVAMKRTVLTRAAEHRPQPRRRGRRTGIVIGVIAVLALGATSGGVALGMIPQPFAAAPAASPAPTQPAQTPSRSSAPVVEEPTETPTPTPTPTSTRKPYALDDPSTWTISGSEVGPVAVGGDDDAESDDLESAYRLLPSPESSCTLPGTWARAGSATIHVASEDGRVVGVEVRPPGDTTPDSLVAGPTTAAGIGVGSTSEDLRAAYPNLVQSSDLTGPWSMWQADVADGTLRFQIGNDGDHVNSVWVSTDPNRPTAKCDV